MPGPWGLQSLRHTGFRYLFGGQLTSNLGDGLYAVALPWYVLGHHGGALLLAVVLAAYGVPRTLLILVGGQAADRWGPWTVMMAADGVRALAAGALAAVVASGPAHAATLVPVAVVLGAGEGLFLPGSLSIIPSLLPGAELQAGNALAEAGTQFAALVGPALGGVVVATAGPTLASWWTPSPSSCRRPRWRVSGPTWATPVRSRPGPAPVENQGSVSDSVPAQSTLRQVLRKERVLQIIIVITAAANLGSGGLSEVALPSLAHGPFHAGATGYGVLVAVFALGGLLGTLVAGQTAGFRRPAVVVSGAFATAAVLISVAPYLGSAIAAGVALALFGGLTGFGNIVVVTAVQKWTDPAVLGRVMGVVVLAAVGIFPISVLFGGAVVHGLGPAAFFPVAGGILLVAILGGLTAREWREFGRTDRAQAVPED